MNYELCKKLKEAGFPIKEKQCQNCEGSGHRFMIPGLCSACHGTGIDQDKSIPALSELINAIGFSFERLEQKKDGRTPEGYRVLSGWFAIAWDADDTWTGEGETAEIAVANLWLNIQAPDHRAKTAFHGIKFIG